MNVSVLLFHRFACMYTLISKHMDTQATISILRTTDVDDVAVRFVRVVYVR